MLSRFIRSSWRLFVTLCTAFEYCARYFLLWLSHGFKMARTQRSHWLHECCATALRRLNMPINITGTIPERGLITANHLSYLDIMVLSAVCECTFVAKTEVRYWPVFGWMATMAGTVYVDRERPLATAKVNDELSAALETGIRVVMFPESTSSDGSQVRPFRSSLFAAAVTSRAAITPAYLRYGADDGSVENDVCYWGDMTFFPHLLRLLALRGLRATLRFRAPAAPFSDRKLAAKEMHAAVQTLGAAE